MDILSTTGQVLFSAPAKTIKELVEAAVRAKASLRGANLISADLSWADLSGADLSWANLCGADLSSANLCGADLSSANLSGAHLSSAHLRWADLSGADLSSADLSGANLRYADLYGRKIEAIRIYSGLYRYQVWAVFFEDGSRWVRMGCLFKSLEDWEKVGIRNSNLSEFPDDGSDPSEERVRAFEFAVAAALRLKAGRS
jgi:uncharacterized protein YjbI with pentapeptide repeats